jgi:hypothetical protein
MQRNLRLPGIGLLLMILFTSAAFAQVTGDYRSATSGQWGTTATWERYDGSAWVAATGTQAPGSSANVTIQSGHTVTLEAGKSCNNLTIATGATLNSSLTNPNSNFLRVGSVAGSNAIIANNGVLGAATLGGTGDGIALEVPTQAAGLKLTGTGVTNIYRVRANVANANTSPTTAVTFEIDQDMGVSGPFTAYYNTANNSASDNFVYTINAGKVVKVNGQFHANTSNGNSGGLYRYNINGTLDLSGSTVTSYINTTTNAASVTTINVAGALKLGTGFSNTAPTSVMNVASGGLVDASVTTSLVTVVPFVTNGTAYIKRTVGAADVNFPVAPTTAGYNPVILNNSGVADDFSVSVKNGFSVPPAQTAQVNKEWTITEATPGGSAAIVKLGWIAADQIGGFDPAGSVSIIRYNGTVYQTIPATVSGSGTVADPYIATSNAPVTVFSPFGVVNDGALPVSLLSFNASYADQKVNLAWKTANEVNVNRFEVETSLNGKDFNTVGTVSARNAGATVTYSYVHPIRLNGTAFYRLKMIDKDGSFTYSSVAKLKSASKGDFTIAPNPVKGNTVNLQVEGMTKGSYTVSVFNNIGQQVFTKAISHDGGSATYQLQLPGTVKAGIYNLQLKDGESVINKKVVVE